MPFIKPNLDDRHFQDIVDEAKRLIPRYCPEWTDHNVSDPGVALIELFAWMTDMLLYRVNQVPDKVYLTLLDMMGITPELPRAAHAPVTFYLSAAQPDTVVIPSDTEVATIRTETTPAVIFTTEAKLSIYPAILTGAYTRNASAQVATGAWIVQDLRQLEQADGRIIMFPKQPKPNDSFYLALENDHSHHVMALVMQCDEARGAGVDPTNPPVEWQVWQGGVARWATCELEFDGTGGFNKAGEIVLRLPAMAKETLQGVSAFWLRCRLTDVQATNNAYEVSPELLSLRVESRGGTVGARHAVTVTNEIVGRSDGTPGQVFRLINTPVLDRNAMQDYLVVDPPLPGRKIEWEEVPDFANSRGEHQHYTLDSADGTITFGPSLLQPDGQIQSFGAVPPRGSTLRFNRYQYGGGVAGNLPKHALAVLKTSIPYVARVTNWLPASGGRDAQSLDDARLRAPQVLRTRTRAMTADDYEFLSGEVPGVARACCLGPGSQPGSPNDPKPGQVHVYVLPQVDNPYDRIPSEAVTLSADLRGRVMNHLDMRRPLGISLEVRGFQVLWVTVEVKLRVRERSEPALIRNVQLDAEKALNDYLNPYIGGPQGSGWPFGRDLHVSEIYALVQRIQGVEFVEEVKLALTEPGSQKSQPVSQRLDVPPNALISSAQHRVVVS